MFKKNKCNYAWIFPRLCEILGYELQESGQFKWKNFFNVIVISLCIYLTIITSGNFWFFCLLGMLIKECENAYGV